ncbi:MAG: NUDIX domain-containing protein [Verrucomicrobiaceae bacterium]|jgi:ADP-ribose pyrophosphatase|nr:NUDIX domain-containing protein [Verrucomicrobiales bacterium]NCF92603.1 NUDIX domain-containing protein [Verrucomicrobiaceae bacterium]MDA7525669.1 NUDIX domain-containing protein [Verrucomicrobiales bacterium]MDA7643725.1 NUDIX domain-containing protein [Verrucomicrobiales bacterium]MDB2346762.1 NUDIX domain-containing protein [Verrucomicrobiales bacterium]
MSVPDTQPVEAAFHYCPSCGEARDGGGNPLTCVCAFRYFFNPAGAVGTLVSDASGRVLFIRRERDPGKSKLGMPGGFIDAGESGEEAARREAYEEVGLTLGELSYLTSHPNTYAYDGVVYQVTDFFYTAKVECFEGIESDASEVQDWFIAQPEDVRKEDFAFESNAFAVDTYVRKRVNAE